MVRGTTGGSVLDQKSCFCKFETVKRSHNKKSQNLKHNYATLCSMYCGNFVGKRWYGDGLCVQASKFKMVQGTPPSPSVILLDRSSSVISLVFDERGSGLDQRGRGVRRGAKARKTSTWRSHTGVQTAPWPRWLRHWTGVTIENAYLYCVVYVRQCHCQRGKQRGLIEINVSK